MTVGPYRGSSLHTVRHLRLRQRIVRKAVIAVPTTTTVRQPPRSRKVAPRWVALPALPACYQTNDEIATLAVLYRKAGHRLPPLTIPAVLSSTPPDHLQWPTSLPVWVISINPQRYQTFRTRFPVDHQLWPGTRGQDLALTQWVTRLKTRSLKRGEIGCYDSHLRLWQHIVDTQTPRALIGEDDVDLRGTAVQNHYLHTLLSEVETHPWDVLFLSWFRPDGGATVTPHTRSQWSFCQMWAYMVTLEGAKKLLADPLVQALHWPVDVALWEAHQRGHVRNLVAYPPLTLTVGAASDTRGIP